MCGFVVNTNTSYHGTQTSHQERKWQTRLRERLIQNETKTQIIPGRDPCSGQYSTQRKTALLMTIHSWKKELEISEENAFGCCENILPPRLKGKTWEFSEAPASSFYEDIHGLWSADIPKLVGLACVFHSKVFWGIGAARYVQANFITISPCCRSVQESFNWSHKSSRHIQQLSAGDGDSAWPFINRSVCCREGSGSILTYESFCVPPMSTFIHL